MDNYINLIDNIESANDALDTAKEKAQEYFGKILGEMGKGNLSRETILRVHLYAHSVQIITEYYSAGYADTSEYTIPLSILKADNPLEAAKEYKINKELLAKDKTKHQLTKEIQLLQNKLNELS